MTTLTEAIRYLIMLSESDRTNLPDKPSAPANVHNGPVHKMVRMITTKFWDAYLKKNSVAKAWLSDGGLDFAIGTKGKLEMKTNK